MGTPLLISLAIHIPAAITWLGLVLYHAIVAAVPFLTVQQRASLIRRPRWVVLGCIPVIMVTGIYQTIYNPFRTVTDIASLEALRNETTYGLALFWKHGFVMASFGITLLLMYWLAPRLAASEGNSARLSGLAAWANVASCAALLLCVAVMVHQLH